MLRREPTKIMLTMDDVNKYKEEAEKKEKAKREQDERAAINAGQAAAAQNPIQDQRTRDQRIGVSNSRAG